MFYSFQKEYPTAQSEESFLKKLVKLITTYQGSAERSAIIDIKNYVDGNNTFITNYKKMIWSDDAKQLVENIYAPNFKTSYNFLSNYTSQIVNALYGEVPEIDGIEKKTAKKMGFAGQSATFEALVCGYSFTYEGINDNFIVFKTEDCIAFLDDFTNEIVRFVRFWNKKINAKEYLFFELYDENGLTTYIYDNSKVEVWKEFKGYKTVVTKSALTNEANIKTLGKLPIVLHRANQYLTSIFTNNLRFKIDLIDLIESGLANNIEEFSDVWMSINVPSATQEDVQRIKDTARKAKAIIFAGSDDRNSVGFNTLDIPYQARQTAVNMLKEELVEDAGIIDFKQISGQATATEINARTYKLKQKVSQVEWFADEYFEELVELWQIYNDVSFDIDITFSKLFINNNTELVNNAVNLYGKISNKAFLNLLKQANIIDNVEEEQLEQDKESTSKFDIGDVYGNFTSTQTSRPDVEPNTESE